GTALVSRNERPYALNTGDRALACQLSKRPVGGHAADAEIGGDLVFRGDARVSRPLAALDAAADELLDRFVARHRSVFECGHFVPSSKRCHQLKPRLSRIPNNTCV